MAERKITKTVDVENGTITFTQKSDGATFTADANLLTDGYKKLSEIGKQVMLHGLSAKLGDSYSGDIEKALEHAEKCFNALQEGIFRSTGGGGGGGVRVTLLAQAIADVHKLEVEKVAEKLKDMSTEEKKKIGASPKVKARMQELKIERAKDALKNASEEGEEVEFTL